MRIALFCAAAGILTSPALASTEEAPKAAAKPGGAVSKLIPTTYGGQKLHRVSSDGKIEPFKMPAGTRWGEGSLEGSNDPLLSPAGDLLAFVQKGSLLIRPLEGGKTTTVVGGYPNEALLITGWSVDGTQLVYFLGPPQAEDPPASKITEPKHFAYDLKSKATREMKIPGQVCGWLPGGEMLLYDAEKNVLQSLALTDGAEPKEVFKDGWSYGQITLHPDGKRIAADRGKPNDTSSCQLVEVDLATGKVSDLNKAGEWAEFQWPKWSPAGKRVSWLARVSMVEGIPKSVVVVDRKPVGKAAEVSWYEWLTDDVLVVVEPEALVVVDVTSGKTLGRKVLSGQKK